MRGADGEIRRLPPWLRALLTASCTLQCKAWWFWDSAADLSGHYAEHDPQGNYVSHGNVMKYNAAYQAVFPGRDWSPTVITLSGSTVTLGQMQGTFANGVITFSNGWNWRSVPAGWTPPSNELPADDDQGTCSWKPLSDHGDTSTLCYGHVVKQHAKAKDTAECLDSYSKDNLCVFVTFDSATGTCYCKHSCPAKVRKASTSSFEKVYGTGALTGAYVEYSPEGNVGASGTVTHTGSKLKAVFPQHTWSPADGYMLASGEIFMFGGSLKGYHNDGTITWQNGWKWVFEKALPSEVVSAEASKKIGGNDEAAIGNEGWVSSRAQTPHIEQAPSELVNFAWKAAANVTCEVSEEDIQHYDEHGWVLLKQVLDPGALDLILDEAKTICEKQLKDRGVCQIEQLRWQVNRFRDFMLYSPMGCYAHKLIRGKGVRITTEALFGTKHNKVNPKFFSYNFHVDSMNGHRGIYHAFHGRSKGVSVWFPMHDVDPAVTGGSVYVVDGYVGNKVKHHCRYLECGGPVWATKSLMPQNLQCTAECQKYPSPTFEEKRKTFKFTKGDAVFWHPEMPHMTQPVTKHDFTRHSFTIRLIESDAEVCNPQGNCGDWMGCCADLPPKSGNVMNHCFPQIYPQVLDEEVAEHYSSTPKHLMGDQSWVDFMHTIPAAPECL